MKRPLRLALFALGCVACDEHGVSIGSQELCQLDARLAAAEERSGAQALPACSSIGDSRLVDGSFETPRIGDCNAGDFCTFPAAEVQGWDTTGELQVIEIWNDNYHDVPAADGKQFVELDASTQDTLFQDLAIEPGQLMYWSLLHRGRLGLETMELLIGPPEAMVSQGMLESPNDKWTSYSGLYKAGKDEVTRFALASRTGTSEGNFVDGVVFAPVE